MVMSFKSKISGFNDMVLKKNDLAGRKTMSKKSINSLVILSLMLSLVAILMVYIQIEKTPAEDGKKNAFVEYKSMLRKALKEEPEIIIEAMTSLHEKKEQEEKTQQKEALEKEKDQVHAHEAPFIGNKDGDVTVVEFFDYRCGFCRRAYGEVKKLLEEDSNVKIILKEYPIMGQDHSLSLAALAAHKQDKYAEYHDALMKLEDSSDEKMLKKIAKDIGLNLKRWEADRNSKELRNQVIKNIALGQRLSINGTPTFIIGEEVFPGAIPADAMEKAISRHRS